MIKDITLIQAYAVMFTDYPDVVNVRELCKMLGICSKKAYELIRSGSIPTIPCSKSYKIAKLDIIAFLLKEQNAAQN